MCQNSFYWKFTKKKTFCEKIMNGCISHEEARKTEPTLPNQTATPVSQLRSLRDGLAGFLNLFPNVGIDDFDKRTFHS
jgi:hypothetical protein